MFLALKEMTRAKVRFGLLIAAIGMLVFLILFQQSLQNGLLTSFVGAIRNQTAPVLVYTVDGQRVIQGSVITPDLEQLVRSAAEVGERRPHRAGHVHRRHLRRRGAIRHDDPRLRRPGARSAGGAEWRPHAGVSGRGGRQRGRRLATGSTWATP